MKLLPWKSLTGEQTRNRIYLYTLDIGTMIGLFVGVAFSVILSTVNWTYYVSTVDMVKLANVTQAHNGVLDSFLMTSLLGLLAPLGIVGWIYCKVSRIYYFMFKRLGFDIGYVSEAQT